MEGPALCLFSMHQTGRSWVWYYYPHDKLSSLSGEVGVVGVVSLPLFALPSILNYSEREIIRNYMLDDEGRFKCLLNA